MIDALLTLIQNGPKDPEMPESYFHWIADEAMIVLRNQEKRIPGLGKFLTDLYLDEEQHHVIRDYALQHLGALAEKDEHVSKEHENLLWEVLGGERNDTYAGTAAIALANGMAGPAARSKLERMIAGELQTSKPEDPSFSTFLQLCGDSPPVETLAVIKNVATDDHANLVSRLSAIAALARINAEGAPEILSDLCKSEIQPIKSCAQTHLNSLINNKSMQ